MTGAIKDDRKTQLYVSWTSKLADATVVKKGRRPRFWFEQIKRGRLRPSGVSPAYMPFAQLHAARMIRIYRRYDRVEMTPEEREKFEASVLRFKGRPASESFALISLDMARLSRDLTRFETNTGQDLKKVESKVDEVLGLLRKDKALEL